jgi:hypothetical protein
VEVGGRNTGEVDLCLGAWVAPLPTLHALAVESASGFEYLPNLLNVIDLGGGNTAIVIGQRGDNSGSLSLVEYHDGVDLSHMPILQSIGAGEGSQAEILVREEIGEISAFHQQSGSIKRGRQRRGGSTTPGRSSASLMQTVNLGMGKSSAKKILRRVMEIC